MGVTGYENLTDEEIKTKLESIQRAKYNLESEQRHREEAAKAERYKDIIGKIFYNKESNMIAKVTSVRQMLAAIDGQTEARPEYVCRVIEYFDNSGTFLLQTLASKGFTINSEVTYKQFDSESWELVTEERANEILDKWKKNVSRVHII